MIPVASSAQPEAPPPGYGFVRVFTPVPGTVLMAGDSTLGSAGEVHTLPVGLHVLRLTEGEPGAWNPRVDSAEVEVTADVRGTVVNLRLPVRYRIATLPSGARIVLEGAGGTREPLGLTPLVIDRREPLAGTLVATRAGFADARAVPGDSSENRVSLVLSPLSEREGATVDWRPPRRARIWIDVAAAGLALAGAAASIHYKFRADAVDDRYRSPGSPERGDQALRVEAQRLDRISAGALGVMQVGLGVLAIWLVLR
jgi:hypothetical protein